MSTTLAREASPAQAAAAASVISLGLFAGEGELPVAVARDALKKGFDLFVYVLDKADRPHYLPLVPADRIRVVRPGCLQQNFDWLHHDGVRHVVWAGKVNKWRFLKAPIFDRRAWALWQAARQLNDDAVMQGLLAECEREGILVLPQPMFLEKTFIQPGVYTRRLPTAVEEHDIVFGFQLAKEMGRLDVGQTIVVTKGMVLAVEAIEGTDQAILRARKWGNRKGGVVVKVEKPQQDKRFDVPTVGPRTLKAMKKAGLKVLAVEAGTTIVLHHEALVRLANQWDMTLIAL